MSNEKPILFSGEMVRAILDGRKTQTRRVVKQLVGTGDVEPGFYDGEWFQWVDGEKATSFHCPFGEPGTRLWVREAWQPIPSARPSGYSSNPELKGKDYWYRATDFLPTWGEKWRPSNHMPREASRITLEVTNVRVQRVQEISHHDAIQEGLIEWSDPPRVETLHYGLSRADCWEGRPELAFRRIWNDINGKRLGCSWDDNPWVWAVTFKVIS